MLYAVVLNTKNSVFKYIVYYIIYKYIVNEMCYQINLITSSTDLIYGKKWNSFILLQATSCQIRSVICDNLVSLAVIIALPMKSLSPKTATLIIDVTF